MARRESFFHGSNQQLDAVLPARAAGAAAHSSSHRNVKNRVGGPYDPYEHAHVTEKEGTAWYFAGRAADNGGGRSRVFTTGAAADQRMGLEHRRNPEHSGMNSHEWVSRTGFPVTGQIDIQPPSRQWDPDGKQGTLPIDWRPFYDNGRDHNGHPYGVGDTQANHPVGYHLEAEQVAIQRQAAVRAGTAMPSGKELKYPPMYDEAGNKLPDAVSEKAQRPRGQAQPMLPGMRGLKKAAKKK